MNAPLLETERLTLRGYRLADFPAHDAMWADARTRRLFAHRPYSEEDTWLRFQRSFGQWALMGCGFWALEERQSGLYAGSVGFFHARRGMTIPFGDAPEAGWVVAPDLCGKGLAGEALTAALVWMDSHVDAAESWCMIDPGNAPSLKLAAKVGYRPAMVADYKGFAMQTFLRPRGNL